MSTDREDRRFDGQLDDDVLPARLQHAHTTTILIREHPLYGQGVREVWEVWEV